MNPSPSSAIESVLADASVARRPRFVLTMAASMGIGPLLVYGLSATSPLVIEDLALSRTQFGTFAATAFVVAALASSMVGRFVDQHSARTSLAILFGGAGAAFVVASSADVYLLVLLAVAVSGAAQALSNPVTNRLVSTHAARRERGVLMGLKQAGVQTAQLFAAVVFPSLALLVGWRGALGSAALVAVLALVLAWRTVPTELAPDQHAEFLPGRLPAVVWWMAGHALLTGAALQAVNVYLPLYGYEALGLPVATAALTAAVVGGVGLVARIMWGRTADRGRSARLPLLVLGSIATLAALCILAADLWSTTSLLWIGAALFGASGIAANVVLMVAVVRAVPVRIVGRATGVLAMGLYLGFAIGPVSFGALADATGTYDAGWTAVALVYVVSALLVLFGGFDNSSRSGSAPVGELT